MSIESRQNTDPLSRDFTVHNREALDIFLRETQFPVNILEIAAECIKQLYGKDAILELKVVTDPEEGDRELFIYINHGLNNEQAQEKYFKMLEVLVHILEGHPKILNISPKYK